MAKNIVKPCTILFIFESVIMVTWEEDGVFESGTVERVKTDRFNEGESAFCSFKTNKAGHLAPDSVFKHKQVQEEQEE